MAKKRIKFRAVVTVKTPVTITFRTKSGDTVSFKAVKTEKKPQMVEFQAKEKKK